MKTRFLVSLLSIIPLAGTLVRFVPPPRTPPLATARQKIVHNGLTQHSWQQSRKVYLSGRFLCRRRARPDKAIAMRLRAGEPQIASQFLNNLGGCRFALHQYREALQAYLEARKLAEASHDTATAGKLDFNIASLYSNLGQMDAATEAISRAMTHLSGPDACAQLPKLLTHLAGFAGRAGTACRRRWICTGRRLPPPAARATGKCTPWRGTTWATNTSNTEEFSKAEYRAAGSLSRAQAPPPAQGRKFLPESWNVAPGAGRPAARPRSCWIAPWPSPRQPGGLRPNWEVYYARGRVRLVTEPSPRRPGRSAA